jgi:hypothetical protein
MNNIASNQGLSEKPNYIILPDKEKILSLTYNEKLKYMDELRIYYPKMNQILQRVEECQHSTMTSERPLCMRISGPSGSGKTTIVAIHLKKYPEIDTPTGAEKPVLYSRIPCPAYIGGLASKLLHDLGDPFYAKSGKITLHTQRLYSLLKACKVKIIFLDEVQHLVDRNSQKLLRDSSDWFKELIDETRIPIVFLGMPDSNKIFIENEQLVNRVRLTENTSPFSYDDIFRKFLYLFDLSLPLKELSGLADSAMSKRMYIATKGLIKHIRDLIIESTNTALQNSSSRVSMPMFAQAYNKILYNKHETNPFSPGFEVGKDINKNL